MSEQESRWDKSCSEPGIEGVVYAVDGRCKVIWARAFDSSESPAKAVAGLSTDLAEALAEEGMELAIVGEALSHIEDGGDKSFKLIRGKGESLAISPLLGYKDLWIALATRSSAHPSEMILERLSFNWGTHFAKTKVAGSRRISPSIRVLVVDDNALSVELNMRLLKKLNCRVNGACSGGEAMALAARSEFDLVFMDLHMPGIGGLETTRLLKGRSRQTWGHAPLVVGLSAAITDEEKREAIGCGMDLVRLKPASVDMFRQVIGEFNANAGKVSLRKLEVYEGNDFSLLDLGLLPALNLEYWEGEEDLHRRMIHMLLGQGEDFLAKIDGFRGPSDFESLAIAVHTLKGGADIVRADRLSALAERTLKVIDGRKSDDISTLVGQFPREFEKFKNAAIEGGFVS